MTHMHGLNKQKKSMSIPHLGPNAASRSFSRRGELTSNHHLIWERAAVSHIYMDSSIR